MKTLAPIVYYSAPPGLGYFIFSLVISISIVIFLVIALLVREIFKVSIRIKEAVLIVLLFIPSFTLSSYMFRGREDGVTVHSIEYGRSYEGAYLFYGFPAIMYQMFEPYDPNFKNVYSGLSNFYFDGLIINLVFWLTIPLILICAVKFLRNEKTKEFE